VRKRIFTPVATSGRQQDCARCTEASFLSLFSRIAILLYVSWSEQFYPPWGRHRAAPFEPSRMPFAFGCSLWQVRPAPKEILDEKAAHSFAACLVPVYPTPSPRAKRKLWYPAAVPVFVLQLWPSVFRSSVLQWLLWSSLLRPAGLLLPPTLLLWRILSATLSGLRARLVRLRRLGWLLRPVPKFAGAAKVRKTTFPDSSFIALGGRASSLGVVERCQYRQGTTARGLSKSLWINVDEST
jgi:hypothetical protein